MVMDGDSVEVIVVVVDVFGVVGCDLVLLVVD